MATKKTQSVDEAMTEGELDIVEPAKAAFDLAKYTVSSQPIKETVTIPETGDSFEVTVKTLSWSKRNQILADSIQWKTDGNTSFNSDAYSRACLKEVLIDAPWGRTTEAFLISIDSRLGTALEALVPKAFGQGDEIDPDTVKKE